MIFKKKKNYDFSKKLLLLGVLICAILHMLDKPFLQYNKLFIKSHVNLCPYSTC